MSKLQAKDLMIGDWVLNTHNNPEKVQQIIANFNDELAIMLDGNCIYGSDEIAPIPLTAEILEKNFPDTEILVWYGNEDKWHIECPTHWMPIPPLAEVEPADLVIFGDATCATAHIGLVESAGGGQFVTIEGNTKMGAATPNGGQVCRKTYATNGAGLVELRLGQRLKSWDKVTFYKIKIK